MENDVELLKQQINSHAQLIEEFHQNLKSKEEQILILNKQNQKYEQIQEKMSRKLELFDEFTTDSKGSKIQYSVKTNLKSEIMQYLIEEIKFQQNFSKLEQKIQDNNFNQNQKITQISKDLVNIESHYNSQFCQFKDSIEFLQELQKNKLFQKNFLEKFNEFMDLLLKIKIKQSEIESRSDIWESQLLKKIDINDLQKIQDQFRDNYVTKQQFTTKLESYQTQLYDEIKRKSDIKDLDEKLLQLENKIKMMKFSNKEIYQMSKNQTKDLSKINNSTHKESFESINAPTSSNNAIIGSNVNIVNNINSVRHVNNINKNLKSIDDLMKFDIHEDMGNNDEIKYEINKKFEVVKSLMIKQADIFSAQVIDYSGQIAHTKGNLDGKLKNLQDLISSTQSIVQDSIKKSKQVEQYVLDHMLTKEYVRDFQKKVHQKIDEFDKGYIDTIEKLTQMSNRVNDYLGDLQIRLQFIPTREELIQRLEFVQDVQTENQIIKQDINKIMELIQTHDEFLLLKVYIFIQFI